MTYVSECSAYAGGNNIRYQGRCSGEEEGEEALVEELVSKSRLGSQDSNSLESLRDGGGNGGTGSSEEEGDGSWDSSTSESGDELDYYYKEGEGDVLEFF